MANLGENIYAEGRQAEDAGRNLQGMRQIRQQRFQNNAQQGRYPYAQQGSEEAQASGASSQGAQLRQQVERRMGGQTAPQPQPTFRELEEQGKARPAPQPPPQVSPSANVAGGNSPAYTEVDQQANQTAGPNAQPTNPDAPADPNAPYLKQHEKSGRMLMYDPVTQTYSDNPGQFGAKPPSEEILQKMYSMSPEAAKALQDPAQWERYQRSTFGDQYDAVKSGGGYGWQQGMNNYGGFVAPDGNWYNSAGVLGNRNPFENQTFILSEADLANPERAKAMFEQGRFTDPNASGQQGNGLSLYDYVNNTFGANKDKLAEATKGGQRIAYNPLTGTFESADEYYKAQNEKNRAGREAAHEEEMNRQHALLGSDENEERKRQAGLPYTDRRGQTHYPWDEEQQPKDQLGLTQWNQMPLYQSIDANTLSQFFNRRFGG